MNKQAMYGEDSQKVMEKTDPYLLGRAQGSQRLKNSDWSKLESQLAITVSMEPRRAVVAVPDTRN